MAFIPGSLRGKGALHCEDPPKASKKVNAFGLHSPLRPGQDSSTETGPALEESYEIVDLTNSLPTLRQSGTLWDNAGSMPKDFWMPACAMSGQGHALVGCNVAGPDAYVQIAVAMRYADDPLGTIRAPAIAHASNAPYNFDDGTGFFEPGPRFSKHLSARFVPEDVLIEDVVIRDPKHLTLRVRVSPD